MAVIEIPKFHPGPNTFCKIKKCDSDVNIHAKAMALQLPQKCRELRFITNGELRTRDV